MSDAPIPNYDELRPAEIESHARGLDQGGLEALIGYEGRHADRVQVKQFLVNRLEQLRSGAKPTSGDPSHVQQAGSPASPDTQGPPQNPPSHGNPRNTTQPRR